MKKKYHYDNDFTIKPEKFNDVLLYQLGELMCDVGYVVDFHVHLNWFEFTYVFSGEGTVLTNNVAQNVVKDDIYISMPNEIHKIISNDIQPLRYCFCAFNVTEDSNLCKVIDQIKSLCFNEKCRCFNKNSFSIYFQHMLAEINNNSPISKLLLEYELKTLILRVYNLVSKDTNLEYKVPQVNNVQSLCFNIINYIDTNILTMENVSCLADIFGYNYSYISRCFKKITGESISDYFVNKKLTMAKQMIEEGQLSITEIASNLQYSSIYVFSRGFKNKYKLSPNNYKTSLKK